MAQQPMGSVTGIAPGGFRGRDTKKDLEKAVHEQQTVIHEAGSLLGDLIDNPAVLAIANELEGRINQFLKTDEQSIVLLRIIGKWRNIIEFAPKFAEEKVRKLLGPQLLATMGETQAAP
jgi:hypothetical protein